jgi:hypothetical protein
VIANVKEKNKIKTKQNTKLLHEKVFECTSNKSRTGSIIVETFEIRFWAGCCCVRDLYIKAAAHHCTHNFSKQSVMPHQIAIHIMAFKCPGISDYDLYT